MDYARAIRDFYDQALNRRQLGLIDGLFADVVQFPGPQLLKGNREQVKQNIAAQLQALPSLQYQLLDVIADGDRVACRVRSTAMHTAPHLNFAPTGRPFYQHEIVAYRFTNGRIDEIRTVFDLFTVMVQIGPKPVPLGVWNDTGPAPEAPPRMPPHQAAAFVRLVHDQLERRQLGVIDQCFSPSFVLHGVMPGQPNDREAMKASLLTHWNTFSDAASQIEDIVSNGNKVVVFGHTTGTHTGPLSDLPASGRRIDYRAAGIYEVAQNSIVAMWSVTQTLMLLQQVGSFDRRK